MRSRSVSALINLQGRKGPLKSLEVAMGKRMLKRAVGDSEPNWVVGETDGTLGVGAQPERLPVKARAITTRQVKRVSRIAPTSYAVRPISKARSLGFDHFRRESQLAGHPRLELVTRLPRAAALNLAVFGHSTAKSCLK